jgi:hypothetical protein
MMHRKRTFARGPLAVAAALACISAAAPARAQMAHVPDSDWRRTDRHDALLNAAKAPIFYVEVRFGPYSPSIDSDPKFSDLAAAKRPYASIFGQQCAAGAATGCAAGSTSPLFYFGLELDAVPVRIPYLGALGVGFGWGWTHTSTLANFTVNATNPSQPPGVSGETTGITIMPMHFSIILRGDELMRRTGIPIVPYGKLGAGMHYWRVTNDLGTEIYNPCEKLTLTSKVPAGCGTSSPPGDVNGAGITPTLHIAVGGMLALNFIEPSASARLDETTGVHHAFLFGEYYNDQITFGTNVMRVGTSSFAVGLAADF